MKKKVQVQGDVTPANNVEDLEVLKGLIQEANNRQSGKLPTRGAGVDPATHYNPAKRIKDSYRKLAKRGLVRSLKKFALEEIAKDSPEAPCAKDWLKNKKTLAQMPQTPKSKFAKIAKSDKKAA